ncbi:hypothetical protein K488DRAFT_84748 [Vararia minispora EC-137]|uniref:Uncharacterized protein n=1 Tax=Vararia minispora EC-137 TaxID=1314806 RepID=A0ACB8QPR5_9AGAM|nr:hypothetical protein K488DRAFT_84748 [Vararia minispora EC-137]
MDIEDEASAPWLQDILLRILPASRLRKLAFRRHALTMFLGSQIKRFIASAQALRTLICAGNGAHDDDRRPIPIRLPELPNLIFLGCDSSMLLSSDFSDPLPSLTHTHIDLTAFQPDIATSALWRIQGDTGAVH